MKRRYVSMPTGCLRLDPRQDWWVNSPSREMTVFESEGSHVRTGVLDSDGREIMRLTTRMIGFLPPQGLEE